MAVAMITVVPLGTKSPSVSTYVANIIKIIDKSGLKYQLTPMATIVEGSVDEILNLVRVIHNEPFKMGALRVVTKLEIDDRKDKTLSMEGKIKSIKEKI